jgi:Galactose oxidase, central domain/Kelch motif
MKKPFWLVLSMCGVCLLTSCGASSPSTPPPAALQIMSGTPPDATLQVAYGGGGVGFPLLASGGVPPYRWSWAAATGSSLPPGLSLTDGMISGTPSTPGIFQVVVTLMDSQTPAKQANANYTIKVTAAVLAIATTTLRNGVIGFRYNPHCHIIIIPCRPPFLYGLQLVATGGAPPYTWSWAAAMGSSLPPGFTFSTGGFLEGIPTAVGTYNLVVSVTDSQSPAAQATKNLTLTVVYPPPPSILTGFIPAAGGVNLPYAFTFVASGVPPLTWSETGALPSGLALGTDGVLSGTPTVTGSFPITVMVQDKYAQSATPQNFTIEIFPHGFKATGSMVTGHQLHTATLLASGKVLVAGGQDTSGAPTATAELYDPTTGTFTRTTGDMTTPRASHTATLLANGKVLLTGGGTDTAELFDPASGTFTATTGTMSAMRTAHTSTLLTGGKVLVAGGFDSTSTPIATAELFDPTTGAFTLATGNMTTARVYHTATVLTGGKVLLTGGLDGTNTPGSTAELFDPAAGTFAATTGNMGTTRAYQTATLLASGKVLVAGGVDTTNTSMTAAELYDPAAGTFAPTTSPMGIARARHTATLLKDGTVLVTGGYNPSGVPLSDTELFDPGSASFSPTGSMTSPRFVHTATLLPDGRVLVAGGTDATGVAAATAELYQ